MTFRERWPASRADAERGATAHELTELKTAFRLHSQVGLKRSNAMAAPDFCTCATPAGMTLTGKGDRRRAFSLAEAAGMVEESEDAARAVRWPGFSADMRCAF
jgi:hypothetical protein